MISPHTPPGTRLVVVIADRESLLAMVPPFLRSRAAAMWGDTPTPFSVGDHFVLHRVEPCVATRFGFACRVHNLSGLWSLECFDVAALPDCLVRLQETQPTNVPEDATC